MKVRMIFARDHEGKRFPCDSIQDLEESLAVSWVERGIAEPVEILASPAPKKAKG